MTIQSKDGRMLRLIFKEKETGIYKFLDVATHKEIGQWELRPQEGGEKLILTGSFQDKNFSLAIKKAELRQHPLLTEKFKFFQDHALLR